MSITRTQPWACDMANQGGGEFLFVFSLLRLSAAGLSLPFVTNPPSTPPFHQKNATPPPPLRPLPRALFQLKHLPLQSSDADLLCRPQILSVLCFANLCHRLISSSSSVDRLFLTCRPNGRRAQQQPVALASPGLKPSSSQHQCCAWNAATRLVQ